MRAEAKAPRRKWPWIVGGAALVGAALVAALSTGQLDFVPAENPGAAPAPSSSANHDDPAPTGCLGGTAKDAAMVLAAQKAAPHSSNGAAEVAAALVRWAYQYPYPSEADSDAVSETLIASSAPSTFPAFSEFFASGPNVSGGLVDDGVPYSVSTVPGVWNLESYSESTAKVTIGGGLVEEGALSPTLKVSATVTLDWEAGGWKLVGIQGTRTTESLYSVGTPMTAGC